MPTRFARLCALVGLIACVAGCASPTPDDDPTLPAATGSAPTAPGDQADEDPGSEVPSGPPIGLPADACRLLDPITVARLAGARAAVPVPSTQGPFHSCEYRMTTEAGADASAFLDVTDQRASQLYDLATQGVQVSDLLAVGIRAALSPSTGKVYVLTSHAFFSLQLPTTFGSLTDPAALRTAAEQLATAVVGRLGP